MAIVSQALAGASRLSFCRCDEESIIAGPAVLSLRLGQQGALRCAHTMAPIAGEPGPGSDGWMTCELSGIGILQGLDNDLLSTRRPLAVGPYQHARNVPPEVMGT